MVNYNCIRCGYTTKDKTKMKSHFSRKTICKPEINDINLEDYKEDILKGKSINLETHDSKMTQNDSEMTHYFSKKLKNDSKMTQNDSIMTQIDSIISRKKIEHICKYCDKTFSRKNNLTRHYKTCKEKEKDDIFKKDMMELVTRLNNQLDEHKEQLKTKDMQIEKKDKQIDELIKKAGITQNIQQNIKILAYKNTDISHLTDQDYIYCLNRSNMCIPQLIKKIHFNPQRPENHNVYISNIKNKYIMIYDGIKWNLNNQDETIEDLIDANEFVLEQKLEEWIENGKDYPEIMNKFNRYLEKKEKDDILNKIKEEIKLVLFNNRKIINNQIDI